MKNQKIRLPCIGLGWHVDADSVRKSGAKDQQNSSKQKQRKSRDGMRIFRG